MSEIDENIQSWKCWLFIDRFNFIQFYHKNWPKHVLCAETEKMVNFGNMKFSSFIEDLDVGPYIFRLHIPKDNVNGSKFL